MVIVQYWASQVIVQYKGVVIGEGGVGTIICLLSVYFLCVICDNDEGRVDKVAEYRTRDYYIHSSPMLEMSHLFVDSYRTHK